MYRSACTQPCLEIVNKQTQNEKYWNAQVALYKRASWYSPVSNLLTSLVTRGTTAPTLLSTILPLYVQEVCKKVYKYLQIPSKKYDYPDQLQYREVNIISKILHESKYAIIFFLHNTPSLFCKLLVDKLLFACFEG